MLTRQAMFKTIQEVIYAVVESAKDKPITEEMSLMYDIGADSLETLEVISRTSKILKIKISRTALSSAGCIGDVLDILEKAQAEAQPS